MLNYFRETQEARFATSARRIYGYVSAGFVVAVVALVFAGLAPIWISWATLLFLAFWTLSWPESGSEKMHSKLTEAASRLTSRRAERYGQWAA